MTLEGTCVGAIRLVERLGEGGMGEVWVGVDERLDRRVAVKAIRGERLLDPAARRRFLREARLLSRLEHPNVCRLYELLELDGREFLVLELVAGSSLRELERQGRLTKAEKLDVAEQIVAALAAAHAVSVVHRDLKPENVMVTPDGTVKVLDFGLARSIAEEAVETSGEWGQAGAGEPDVPSAVTRIGDVMGTPRYMSPEQARGEPVTAASDMFSFGLLLHELFTGIDPYGDDHRPTILVQRAMWGEVEPVKGVPAPIAGLIHDLMGFSPSGRPTALAAAQRLRAIRDRPRRRLLRLAAAAAVGGLLAAVAGTGFGLWHARRSLAEAREAQAQAEAVNRFLEGMLASADPGRRGLEVKVVDVLDQAALSIDEEFAGHPLEQAAVLHTLGSTYHALGRYEAARPLLERAVAVRGERLGRRDPATLASRSRLGVLLGAEGELQQAEAALREVLADRREVLGEAHPDTVTSRADLASVLEVQGRYEEAEAELREVVGLLEASVGGEDPSTIAARCSLALVLRRRGRLEPAEELLRSAVSSSRSTLGADHRQTLEAMGDLGAVLAEGGRPQEAEPLFREVVAARTRVLGSEHPDTLTALSNLSQVEGMLGNLEEAESLARQALELRVAVLGEGHPDAIAAAGNLAVVLLRARRTAEAEELMRRAYTTGERVLGEAHPQTLTWMANLSTLLLRDGRVEDAMELARRSYGIKAAELGPDHPSTLLSQHTVADCLMRLGREAEAEAEYRELLERSRRALGDAHPETVRRLGRLTRLLRAAGREAEAADLEAELGVSPTG